MSNSRGLVTIGILATSLLLFAAAVRAHYGRATMRAGAPGAPPRSSAEPSIASVPPTAALPKPPRPSTAEVKTMENQNRVDMARGVVSAYRRLPADETADRSRKALINAMKKCSDEARDELRRAIDAERDGHTRASLQTALAELP